MPKFMADSNVCMREHLQAIAAHGVVCKFAFNMLKLSVAAGCAVWLVCAICQWERGTKEYKEEGQCAQKWGRMLVFFIFGIIKNVLSNSYFILQIFHVKSFKMI